MTTYISIVSKLHVLTAHLSSLLEHLINSKILLRRREEELRVDLLGELRGYLFRNSLLVIVHLCHIDFRSDNELDSVLICLLFQLSMPVGHIVEALIVYGRVNKQDYCRLFVIQLIDGTVLFCTSCVPNLQLDLGSVAASRRLHSQNFCIESRG